MNFSKQFIRKIVYILSMALLLIPLSLIGRPSTRDATSKITDQGGVLSQLRNENELSQSGLSEIDPAGETMKLASLGMRGIAVNILWLQAIDAKEKKEWDTMTSTLNTLVKLQPNFIKVWQYQAHNIAYNVSVEFDDYEYRYNWVKKGINFLTGGIDANKRDHRIVDELGFFSGNKLGTADERVQFRRMFQSDEPFHAEMGEFVNQEDLKHKLSYDNWLLAYEWYELSQEMVDVRGVRLRKQDSMYYNLKPAQLRNMMLSLQDEKRIERDFANVTWSRAHDEWLEYGRRPLEERGGVKYNLEGLGQSLEDLERLRSELDELAPGERETLRKQAVDMARSRNSLTVTELEMLNMPLDQLTDEQRAVVRTAESKLYGFNNQLEFDIAKKAPVSNQGKALRLAQEIYRVMAQMKSMDEQRSVFNYNHWRFQTLAESTNEAITARQVLYDATELSRKSILNQYTQLNPLTDERESKAGAIQEYERTFEIWAEILEKYPTLKEGHLMETIIDDMVEYESLRQTAGLVPYIADHPLQSVIDERAAKGETDGLLTSPEVAKQLQLYNSDESRSNELSPRPNLDFNFDEESKKNQ